MFLSCLDVTNALSAVHIILYEEVSIDQSTVTVRAFPLLLQCWTEGHVSLKGSDRIGSRNALINLNINISNISDVLTTDVNTHHPSKLAQGARDKVMFIIMIQNLHIGFSPFCQ